MFFWNFIKNPQTTIALTFLTHIISGIGGVVSKLYIKCLMKSWVYKTTKNATFDAVETLNN